MALTFFFVPAGTLAAFAPDPLLRRSFRTAEPSGYLHRPALVCSVAATECLFTQGAVPATVDKHGIAVRMHRN